MARFELHGEVWRLLRRFRRCMGICPAQKSLSFAEWIYPHHAHGWALEKLAQALRAQRTHSRDVRWGELGIWTAVFELLVQECKAALILIDSCIIKTHRKAKTVLFVNDRYLRSQITYYLNPDYRNGDSLRPIFIVYVHW